MYGKDDAAFVEHMETADTIQAESRVVAEWNMNIPGNIKEVGNYRHRVGGIDGVDFPTKWTEDDPYTQGATDADTTIYTSLSDDEGPMAFTEPKKKMELLYSLDDCVKHHRPRSGINKPLYIGYTASDSFTAQYINNYGKDIDKRPRYYMGSRYDSFKYWTSYRTENEQEFGISDETGLIEDVAPYVVYENPVPTNRIVIKMQTNVGTVKQGPFRAGVDEIEDPLYGMDKATIPTSFDVEVLLENDKQELEWKLITTVENTDIGPDGHVQLSLGWKLPDNYRIKGEMPDYDALPISGKDGDTYFVVDQNAFYTYKRPMWEAVELYQSWAVDEESLTNKTPVVTNLTDPGDEVAFIKGIRLVVYAMQNPNQTFDLIEMSPRLVADLTDRTMSFNISRIMADLGSKTLPIGDLVVSTGTIDLNNNDGAFSHESKDSIITPYLFSKVKFNFYETVKRGNAFNTIPIKTLYSQGFPQATGNFDNVSMQLRDAYSILESEQAPELFLQDISLSFAVTMLLDSIGFSNYKFFRIDDETETIIPFFFVAPGRSVAEVLQDIAVATQTSMWFNEENDFCVATKRWTLPDNRTVDIVLRGQAEEDIVDIPKLPNIINISSDEKRVANDGTINYTERYLQREKASLEQAMSTNEWQNWVYKASMLWEASPEQNLREYNTTAKTGKSYSLTAIPLEADIPADLPEVTSDGRFINNIIDFGEGTAWLSRSNGYFYANGEIIKFDAVEYVITGTGVRWLRNNDDYQDYFASLPFGGKIYPSGRVQIYAEPYYNEDGSLQPGPVKEHGRGQFGTTPTTHKAGLDEFWKDNTKCFGMLMNSEIMFTADHVREYPTDMTTPSGDTVINDVNEKARASTRTGIIKNQLANTYQVEKENERFNTTRRGTIQSSAFVFEGPADYYKKEEQGSLVETKSVDNISYILKDFGNTSPYRHFGTRMRVIGEIKSQSNTQQRATGAQEYVSLQPKNASEATTLIGGSGGIGMMVNKDNNQGYFFEMVALSQEVYDRNTTNPIYSAKLTIRNKDVKIKTQSEHNIEKGDQFLIRDAPDYLEGQWKAEGVSKDKSEITLRIDESNITNGIDVKVQKLEQPASTMSNLFFYKMMKDSNGDLQPYVLWEGITEIIVDSGLFVDNQRNMSTEKDSVYDIGVEYKDINNIRRFYLYLNGRQIGSVDDVYPLENPKNTMALFTRGKSKCMFNNVYALADRFSENTAAKVTDKIEDVFGVDNITNTEAMRKYAMTGFIQQSYLSSIGTEKLPDYNMWFDEFGTIMRECDYLNIKYDQAYPALAATLAPVINDNKSYVTSGFIAGAYGAEFLIFNATDTNINLDAETGNFLRIQGVAFTQDTTKALTVDDYYGQVARLDRPKMSGSRLIDSPIKKKEEYDNILKSRATYGRQEFEEISSDYIQDDAVAEDMLSWVMSKTLRPRQLIGANVFGVSHMQLGDIVRVDYDVQPTEAKPMEAITSKDKDFVVYQFDYTKTLDGINTTVYLVEV